MLDDSDFIPFQVYLLIIINIKLIPRKKLHIGHLCQSVYAHILKIQSDFLSLNINKIFIQFKRVHLQKPNYYKINSKVIQY